MKHTTLTVDYKRTVYINLYCCNLSIFDRLKPVFCTAGSVMGVIKETKSLFGYLRAIDIESE